MVIHFTKLYGSEIFFAASDILMGTPDMLCFANEKLTIKTKIPKPEVGRGHSLAVGLSLGQHS